MRRYAGLLLIFALVAAFAGAQERTAPSLVSAQAAVLMDRHTGLVLWSLNPDEPLEMASTTKIMTAMVMLDHGSDRLDEPVTVRERHLVGGSSTFAAHDVVTLRGLLMAALINSSNEATVAAADFLAGDEATFIQWMNDKAKELGMGHTHFSNPHGFSKPPRYRHDHKMSAYDLALMTRYALTNYPLIRQIIATKLDHISTEGQRLVRLESHNKNLNKMVPGVPGAVVDGVKTGFIRESGRCYVTSATHNGWQLIAVVLNDPHDFQDAMTLLHYGFTRYQWKTYASPELPGTAARVARGAAATVPLGAKGLLGAPVLRPAYGNGTDVDAVQFVAREPLRAPVKRGAEVGRLVLLRNTVKIADVPAVALADVPVAWWARAGVYAGLVGGLLVLIVVANALYGTRTKNARRRRRQLASGR